MEQEEFKKTPKLVSLRPIPNAIPKFIPLSKLLSTSESLIYIENDKYVIRNKQSDTSENLDFVLIRNFMLSDLMSKAKEMREAQRDFYNFKVSLQHPKKQELLNFATKSEREFDEMMKRMNQVIQPKLFEQNGK